jgi:hypothetical protein
MALSSIRLAVFTAMLVAGTTSAVFAQQKAPADENPLKAPVDESTLKAPPDEDGLNAGGTTGKANDPDDPPSVREHYSAPNGGMSSGAHTGNESPTKKGNSAGDGPESDAARKLHDR